MMLRLNRLHFPVTTLGPGRRLGLWFQGCSIGCVGCVSRDTWDAGRGSTVEISALVAACRDQIGDSLDGVTITGGEPFEQPEALAYLLEQLSDWRAAAQLDVLCYSGMSYKRLASRHSNILARLDGIIPEPFRNGKSVDGAWRGSANQVVISLSELGHLRYDGAEPTVRHLQLSVTDDAIWFIGIPRPGDMERLARIAADRGLVLEDVSWLT